MSICSQGFAKAFYLPARGWRVRVRETDSKAGFPSPGQRPACPTVTSILRARGVRQLGGANAAWTAGPRCLLQRAWMHGKMGPYGHDPRSGYWQYKKRQALLHPHSSSSVNACKE